MATLQVPDANTQKDFIRNARAAFQAAHPTQQPIRGRPSDKARVFSEIQAILRWSKRRPTQRKLIEALRQKFGADPHPDTLRKYVKLWRHYHTPLERLTDKQYAWMEKHQKAEAMQGIQTLQDIRVAWPRALSALVKDISQLSQEINVLRSSPSVPKVLQEP